MHVTKLRIANDNGLVPAGRYFARLAAGLREAHARAAVVVDVYEEQRTRDALHYRKLASPASASAMRLN